MRIIRGKHKGRKIIPPKGFKARPTTDFAKEALFNILQNNYKIVDADVLDLFAGTGSISYEFLSEGCKSVTSVELNRKYVEHIRKTADSLFPGQLKSVCADSFNFCKKQNLNYDIIFADPPFVNDKIQEIPDIIFKNPNIKDEILLILEHSKKNDFSQHPNFTGHRKYGNVNFSFFEKK